jgi:hypothetical protein
VSGQPHHLSLGPAGSRLDLFEWLCLEADASGKLAADADLAAIAVEHGATLVSLDRETWRGSAVSGGVDPANNAG